MPEHLAVERTALRLAHEGHEKRSDQDAGKAHDDKCGTPAIMSREIAAREKPAGRAAREREGEGRQRPPTPPHGNPTGADRKSGVEGRRCAVRVITLAGRRN